MGKGGGCCLFCDSAQRRYNVIAEGRWRETAVTAAVVVVAGDSAFRSNLRVATAVLAAAPIMPKRKG